MKIKKQYLVVILVFLFLLIGTTISFGAFSATNSTVESGGKITVKVTSSEALDAYNLDLESCDGLTFNSCSKTESGAIITINGSSIGYINTSGKTTDLGTYKFTAPEVTEDKEYSIFFKIDRKTTVTSKITVKAPVVTPPPSEPTTPTTPTTPTEPTKSSEARLKNFGIKPNDFKGFKKDTYEYTTEVPNEVKEIEIYAEKLNDKATVEGLGKVSLKEGDNTFKVKVTAEDGKTTKTYTLTIKRKTVAEEENENGEVRLKNLGIKPKEYDFSGFDSEKTEYAVEVLNEIEEIEVYATAMDSKAQVTGIGMITLKEGVNELKVEVIAANGEKKTYTLTVTRKEAEKKEVLGLSILSIEGVNLNPTFKVETYEYTATLAEDMSSLEIKANANNENATVEIVGNENLQQGENLITILVTNKKTGEVATYQIIVNKNVTIVETVQTSWLKPSTWGKEEKIKIAIILVLIILIIWAIVLKIKISKQCPKIKKVNLPGAEELDKAIAEHQELVEEPNYEISDIEKEQKVDYEQNTANQEVEQQNYIEEIAKNRFGSIENETVEKPKRRGRHF